MHFKRLKTASLLLGIHAAFLFPCPALAADNSSWQKFLDVYLKDGLVNYSAVKGHLDVFEDVVFEFENLKQEEYDRWSLDEKKSFWINTYNIEAVKLVLEHYPLKRSLGLSALRYPANSIQQIPDVWNQDALTILGKTVSLNDIENEILRKEFQDPRIHFSIVCASLGCPVLRDEPYVAERLEEQLTDQVRIFVRDPQKVRYDPRANKLYVSPIFKWFEEDFEKAGGVTAFLDKYVLPDMKSPDGVRIQWLDYDWSLNEQ